MAATRSQPASTKPESSRGFATRVRQRLVWLLLVIVVPLLALVVMIAIALQVLGVPVWGTAGKWLNHPGAAGPTTKVQTLEQQLAVAQARVQTLGSENQAKTGQLAAEIQKENQLSSQLANLQQRFQQASSSLQVAKQEAAVMKSMSPQAAAAVLGKMTNSEAAAVIAALAPADAGSILSSMNPAQVSQLLALSAVLQNQASVNSTNSGPSGAGQPATGTATSSATSGNTAG